MLSAKIVDTHSSPKIPEHSLAKVRRATKLNNSPVEMCMKREEENKRNKLSVRGDVAAKWWMCLREGKSVCQPLVNLPLPLLQISAFQWPQVWPGQFIENVILILFFRSWDWPEFLQWQVLPFLLLLLTIPLLLLLRTPPRTSVTVELWLTQRDLNGKPGISFS